MTPDEIVVFAKLLLGANGLRASTAAHLRKLAEHGPEASLAGGGIGTGKTTARAIHLLATGKANHHLSRHEKRAIEATVQSLWKLAPLKKESSA